MPDKDPMLPSFFQPEKPAKPTTAETTGLPKPWSPTKPVPTSAPVAPPAAKDPVLASWETWKADPTPATAGSMLKQLRPVLQRTVSAHVGASSPVVLSEAKRMALAALDRYDPKQGTKITTFLHSQLQGLKRYQRKQVQAIRSSEHMLLQSGRVAGAESELEGELGRPPSETEIARRLDIPLSRLKQIRQQIRGEVAEGRFAHTDSGQAGETPLLVAMNARSLWPELVHADLDPTNQFILEHTLGLFGRPKLKNAEIARRLRVSPGAISQRKSLIQKLLDREQELSPFLED